MTIYLWHLPIIIAVAGFGLLLPIPVPEPASPALWATRPIALFVVLALTLLMSIPLARLRPASLKACGDRMLRAPGSPLPSRSFPPTP
jgi:peptidoglycan/LPS O-acetylase OafA/YrhL